MTSSSHIAHVTCAGARPRGDRHRRSNSCDTEAYRRQFDSWPPYSGAVASIASSLFVETSNVTHSHAMKRSNEYFVVGNNSSIHSPKSYKLMKQRRLSPVADVQRRNICVSLCVAAFWIMSSALVYSTYRDARYSMFGPRQKFAQQWRSTHTYQLASMPRIPDNVLEAAPVWQRAAQNVDDNGFHVCVGVMSYERETPYIHQTLSALERHSLSIKQRALRENIGLKDALNSHPRGNSTGANVTFDVMIVVTKPKHDLDTPNVEVEPEEVEKSEKHFSEEYRSLGGIQLLYDYELFTEADTEFGEKSADTSSQWTEKDKEPPIMSARATKPHDVTTPNIRPVPKQPSETNTDPEIENLPPGVAALAGGGFTLLRERLTPTAIHARILQILADRPECSSILFLEDDAYASQGWDVALQRIFDIVTKDDAMWLYVKLFIADNFEGFHDRHAPVLIFTALVVIFTSMVIFAIGCKVQWRVAFLLGFINAAMLTAALIAVGRQHLPYPLQPLNKFGLVQWGSWYSAVAHMYNPKTVRALVSCMLHPNYQLSAADASIGACLAGRPGLAGHTYLFTPSVFEHIGIKPGYHIDNLPSGYPLRIARHFAGDIIENKAGTRVAASMLPRFSLEHSLNSTVSYESRIWNVLDHLYPVSEVPRGHTRANSLRASAESLALGS